MLLKILVNLQSLHFLVRLYRILVIRSKGLDNFVPSSRAAAVLEQLSRFIGLPHILNNNSVWPLFMWVDASRVQIYDEPLGFVQSRA